MKRAGRGRATAFLRDAYALDAIVERVAGENENYLVATPGGTRYVLKIGGERTTADEIALEHAAVEAVQAVGLGVDLPRLVPTTGGAWYAVYGSEPPRLARLLTFVEGAAWSARPPASAARRRGTGHTIGLMARALSEVNVPAAHRTHGWDLTRAGAWWHEVSTIEDPSKRRLLDEAFRLWAGVAPFLSDLPHGLIHGDLNDDNLLVENDALVGILDFGDALHNPVVCDLAIALAYLLLGDADWKAAGADLVAGYHAVRPLAAAELEVLFPLVCGRLAQSLAISSARRKRDPARAAWFVTEEKAWTALENYLACSPATAADAWAARTGVAVFAHRATTPETLLEKRRQHFSAALSLSYRAPVRFVRGRGAYLYDAHGYPYLDLYNNVAHVGHSHPRVVEAAHAQMARLNTNTRYLYDELTDYAEALCATLPPDLSHCFFVNSGTEANELALRLARAYTRRDDVLVVENAYHGHSAALIEVSPYKWKGESGHPRPHVHVVPVPDGYRGEYAGAGAGVAYGDAVGEKIAAMARPPAAFLAESLLSCGGQVIPPEGYFETVFGHVRAAGGVCILDEVQTGFGRVGTHFWAFEAQNVVPDIVVMGKPMGNGYPMGAVVTTRAIAEAFAAQGVEFFATFGGNPVACAVGLEVLRVIEDEGLQARALDVGTFLRDALRDLMDTHPAIGDVRGAGLFIGVELVRDRASKTPAPEKAAALVEALRHRRILTGTDGPHQNVVKIKGPLVLTRDEAAMAVRAFADCL